jgi:hypothetical protein
MPSNICPDTLRLALHELLYHTLLRIRLDCSDSKLVFVHADHVHNVPAMLSEFQPERLRFYWEVERPCFLQNLPAGSSPPPIFESLWAVIEREYQRICKPGSG